MCKYCKRLKELKELDEKEYKKIINAWKLRDEKARILVSQLYGQLLYDGSSVLFIAEKVADFLNCDCV